MIKWGHGTRKEVIVLFARSFKRKIIEFHGRKVICMDLEAILKQLAC